MATFVYLFQSDKQKKIQKGGIKQNNVHNPVEKGVFCMPVTKDFYATHQWARELMRWNKKNIVGAYFRVPDTEEVWYGRYNKKHKKGTASEAAKAFSRKENMWGFQVIIPRSITSKEIFRIKDIPPLGWRFSPDSKGRKPCLCPYCIDRGEYGSQKMLEQNLSKLQKKLTRLEPLKQRNTLWDMSKIISEHKLPLKTWQKLIKQVDVSDERVLLALGEVLINLRNDEALDTLLELIKERSVSVKISIASDIIHNRGIYGISKLGDLIKIPEIMAEVKKYESIEE